jgi:anti-sigma-K factor RskA
MKPENYIASGILELYVAGVLPEDEMQEVGFVVSQDPILQAEVKAMETALLTYAQTQAQLPNGVVLPRILENLHKAEPVPTEAHSQQNAVKKKKAKENQVAEARRIKIKEQAPSTSGVGLNLAWAALWLILLVASVGANIFLYTRWKEAEQTAQNFETEKSQSIADLKSLKEKYTQTENELNIYKNPHLRTVQLKGVPEHSTMLASVMYDRQTAKVYLKIQNLPVPPPDKQYQLWGLTEDGDPISAGMLPQNTQPGVMVNMSNVRNAQGFAITLENAGGSEKPTLNQMYVTGNI